ncbi:type I-B CRISPR-associated protein Cas5b [Cyclobacterium sp. 1_MG-2023]|uniref:type I-B CRISPR-associated protein Cas5b n=1 Tax=Cyclobacterium sp. 1_MG-2023 TaxID=3062681 RepID=UPI0026E1B582|nr:type I-B CRISPR-associated protein Cas5b [Cyclobacterium sp. 1_MG-2023]MDO6437057.1 type I-B CRISPR-associated protein Cas5b [Cyclobacterium sp. 1_MG-2023]
MISKTALIFDISGEYGHFRKFNTTTSPLTYSIPTTSAIYGLLGAVLGIEREDSHNKIREKKEHLREVFSSKNASVAVRPLSEIKKVNIGFNLLDTGSYQSFFNVTNRTQIEYELLKDPKFRIYLRWEHQLKDELIERLKIKRYHFNPYLGISQMTANIDFVAERELSKISEGDYVEFNSAINLSEMQTEKAPIDINLIKERTFQVETFPLDMQIDRTIKRYGEILIEMNGNNLRAIPTKNSFTIENEGNIQFL